MTDRQIAQCYLAGASLQETARKAGCAVFTVARRLEAQNIPRRSRARLTRRTEKQFNLSAVEMQAMRTEGATLKAIASAVGCSIWAVWARTKTRPK